jgi:hypothetical protein
MKKTLFAIFPALSLGGCISPEISGVAASIARIYGYKTLAGLVEANAGLLTILTALICVTLVFSRLLNRQFPTAGRQPVKTWIFKVTMIFFICAFVFVCGFTVFYEKKKMDNHQSTRTQATEQFLA